MTYKITFRVKGDHIAPDFEISEEYDTETLDELAILSYNEFFKTTKYVWKNMEAGIFMEPRPNPIMSIECLKDNVPVDEMDVFDAYYKIRVSEIKTRIYK